MIRYKNSLPSWFPYVVAVGGTLLIALLRYSIKDAAGTRAPLIFFTIPISIAAFYGGARPGLLASALSLIIGTYFFLTPDKTFLINSAGDAIALVGSLLAWLVICGLGELLRVANENEEKAQKSLAASNESYQTVLDRMSDGFYALDKDWNVTFANRALLELVQSDYDAVVGKHFLQAFDYAGNQHLFEELQAVSSNPTGLNIVKVADEAGQLHFELRVYGSTEQKAPTGVFVQNVSEKVVLERLREQQLADERAKRSDAEQANRMKDEFVATLSHELRTPLTAIVGWTDILRSKIDKYPEIEEGIETIDRSVRLQAQLIDDLLDMSRIVTGQLSYSWEVLDIAELAQEVVRDMTLRAQDSHRGLSLAVEADDLYVRGDHLRLSQVIGNLVSNSLKFTNPNGKIEVRVGARQGQAVITVMDDGIGIEPSVVPQIFEKFQQANATITRERGGLGLGLAIVRQLVEAHGGSVTATSAGLNRGSTFEVLLPLAIAPPTEITPRDDAQAGRDPVQCRIMLVEDDEVTRHMLTTLLTSSGAEVFDFPSVDDAEASLDVLRPDLLISDIGMPMRDGYDMVRVLRASRETQIARTPAIALTAFAQTEDREAAIAAGFDLHVPKPVRRDDLLHAIRRLRAQTR
ncbi:MAG: response regulator [Chthonomonas sp.]|nr:response regulator [Chthonomonas sp.]